MTTITIINSFPYPHPLVISGTYNSAQYLKTIHAGECASVPLVDTLIAYFMFNQQTVQFPVTVLNSGPFLGWVDPNNPSPESTYGFWPAQTATPLLCKNSSLSSTNSVVIFGSISNLPAPAGGNGTLVNLSGSLNGTPLTTLKVYTDQNTFYVPSGFTQTQGTTTVVHHHYYHYN